MCVELCLAAEERERQGAFNIAPLGAETTGNPPRSKQFGVLTSRPKRRGYSLQPLHPIGAGLVSVTAQAVANRAEDAVKLTDTQLVILSRAAQREDAAAEIPENLIGGAAHRVVAKLLREGLLLEVPSAPGMPVWRRDEEKGAIALRVTPAGLEALGIEASQRPYADPSPAPDAPLPGRSSNTPDSPGGGGSRERQVPRDGTKLAIVIGLLEQAAGASITDLTAATGWLPHTTRAALTGLRKRGYEINKAWEENGPTRYHIGADEYGSRPASIDAKA